MIGQLLLATVLQQEKVYSVKLNQQKIHIKNNLFTMIMEVYLILLVMNIQKKNVVFAVNNSSSRQF